MVKYCPNCEKEFTDEQSESDEEVYSGTSSDPYTGMTYAEYYCKDCVDDYKEETGLLRRMFKGEIDKIDFKLREK